MKKFLTSVLGIIVIATITGIAYRYYEIKQFDPPQQTVYFDDFEIHYDQASVNYDLIGSYYQMTIHYAVDSVLPKIVLNNVEHRINAPDDAIISFKTPSGEIINVNDPENILLREDGLYQFEIIIEEKNLYTEYHFDVNIKLKPVITLPDLTSVQGGILYFEINNAPLNSEVSVTSDFSESNIYQEDNTILFYIPMWYAAEVKEYPLTINLNDESYAYVIDLESYEFRELHFTVATSTVTSTVGNPNAAPEYREIIYPTYESAIDEVYWENNFIMPVLDARISSYFGDMRFVNDATVPTRHVGIDYAIECGTDVLASNGGEVIVAYNLIMIGNTVVIDHGLGLKTYYEHMQDLNVEVGDIVEKGDIIGHVGTTGYSTGCHLHFQSMVKNQSFNPEFLYTWMD